MLNRPEAIVAQEALSPVLVVDLDETLSRTDTLHEALLRIAVTRPLALAHILAGGISDRTAFKTKVADLCVLEPEALALAPEVLYRIEQTRAAGGRVALVSASDHRQVKAVADRLGIFDDAFGTGSDGTDGENLGGQGKADFLVRRYGKGGFDYIGDCARDIPVWQVAANALAVAPAKGLLNEAAQAGVDLRAVRETPEAGNPYLKALRPHQWAKNVLVFLPLLAAQRLDLLPLALLAFALFSLTASSVYIFNDLVDLPSDRRHPRKRHRPFAAGRVPVAHGIVMGTALLGGSFLLSVLAMPAVFTGVLAVYFAVTVAYSVSLKRKLVIDVVVLAGLYTMRIIAGGAAVGIMPSPWLLGFSVFLFYALASVKRQAELIDHARQNKHTAPGRGYVASDAGTMQMISIGSGQAAVLVFALYLYSPAVAELYATPEVLWLICPVLLYWLGRVAILTNRGFMHDDPIVFAARDKVSLMTVGVVALIVLASEWTW